MSQAWFKSILCTYLPSTYVCYRRGDEDPSVLNDFQRCKHSEKSKFLCNKINLAAIVRHRQHFFSKGKVQQDIFLTRYIAPYEPERRKTKTTPSCSTQKKTRSLSVTYFLTGKKKKKLPVCKSFFMKVFSIKKDRLISIAKTVFEGKVPKENRGGDRKSQKSSEKKAKLREFLASLPANESHYNRNKSKRIYLSSDLNISKLRKLYNESVPPELQVKPTMFWEVFVNDFNIGFRSPTSDACSTCILLNNRIAAETDPKKKKTHQIEKRVHKLRAQYFYKMAKMSDPDSLTFCFDLQQVQPLPRTPIQDAFYARQISFYNFCIVAMDSRNPKFYQWSEDLSGRGSTEVGSALLHYLNGIDLAGISVLRLFCDGCGGQNKNSHIVQALLFWLVNKSPENLKEILLTFPVRGHSFLPADRVFGRVEKEIRTKPVIISKDEYYSIYNNHGEVRKLGEDWTILDIKSLLDYYKKIEGMRELKRIVLKKHVITKKRGRRMVTEIQCLVNIYRNYRNEFDDERIPFCLLKRGKRHPTELFEICTTKVLSAAKKKDVGKLLKKQFGDDWANNEEFKWYKDLIDKEENQQEMNDNDEEENFCDCLEVEEANFV